MGRSNRHGNQPSLTGADIAYRHMKIPDNGMHSLDDGVDLCDGVR